MPVANTNARTLTDLLFEKVDTGLCLVAPDGTVVRANAEWLRSTGFTEEQVVGENIVDLFPETRDMALAMHARACAGHRVEVPRHAQIVNGRETWWDGSIEPVPMAGGTGLLIAAREVVGARKRTEEALRESEHKYSTFFEMSPFAIAVNDLRDGTIVAVNDAFVKLFEFTREEVIGRRPVELGISDADSMARLRAQLEQRGALRDVEVTRRTKSGEARVLSINADRVWLGGREMVLSTIQDLTERKRSEDSLRRYELVVQQSRDIILFIRRDDGRILEANPAATAAYGYTHDELLARSIADLRAAETRADIDARMRDAAATGVLFESVHVRKDGSSFPVEVSSRGVLANGTHVLVSVVRDIAERKRTLDALKRREEEARAHAVELEAILDCVADGVVVYDREGRTVRSTPSADALLAIPADQRRAPIQDRIMQQYEVVSEDGRPLQRDEMVAVRAAVYGEVVKDSILRVRSGDGDPRWLRMSAMPLVVDGQHSGAVLSVTDVTQRKRAEEALREADRRKDEFLGMLSHELRNPLAPIRNSTYILRHAAPGSEQARRAQAVIERQTEHMTRLVDDLLDITRISRGKIELRRAEVDLRDVVLRAADDFRLAMDERGIAFHVKVPATRLPADADATRLTQVVGNLLHNAGKFTTRGGQVTLSLAASDGMAEIRVRDTGAGVEPGLLPKIFEAFVQGTRTLARTEGGLGLGLAMVKSIAELHGGTVRAQSAGVGKGAEFVVRLPLLPGGTIRGAGTSARSTRSRRFLVVDDNRDAAESLAELLRLLGHAVDVAYDGASALEAVRPSPPDVVLCDLGLPGMSGYEVAKALRAAGVAAQLLAVSGYAQPEDVKSALEAGFDGHLAKPCDPEQIERLLS